MFSKLSKTDQMIRWSELYYSTTDKLSNLCKIIEGDNQQHCHNCVYVQCEDAAALICENRIYIFVCGYMLFGSIQYIYIVPPNSREYDGFLNCSTITYEHWMCKYPQLKHFRHWQDKGRVKDFELPYMFDQLCALNQQCDTEFEILDLPCIANLFPPPHHYSNLRIPDMWNRV